MIWPWREKFSRKGAGLIELSIGLTVLGLMAGMAACSAMARMNLARAQYTLIEMGSVLTAGQKYHALHGEWPTDIVEVATLLSSGVPKNPWGGQYRMGHQEERLWVETDVPEYASPPEGRWAAVIVFSLIHGSRWRMSVPVTYAQTARLFYEK